MAEYIYRELLLKDLETSIVVSGRNDVAPLELRGVHKVINRIKAMPTEDVVPVVRCKDCKHYMEYTEEYAQTVENAKGDCYIRKINSDNKQFCGCEYNDFCSYGERKE